jgi:hypothetical protein
MRRKRVAIRRQQSKWTASEWQGGWELAMTRLDGAPSTVTTEPVFQECLAVLDGSFADGDSFRFQLGLLTLIDCCAEAVNARDCQQWWE